MQSIADFLQCYNNKVVAPTLEAMQKTIEFHHNKGDDMLKLRWTLPNLASICLNESTKPNFYHFTETDKHLLEKTQEDTLGGPSIRWSLFVKL